MNEFNNRISAQQQILSIVNRSAWREELFGLSRAALDRWTHANGLKAESPLVELLHHAAAQLFFLANKSQEQVTEEYRLQVDAIRALTRQIQASLKDERP